MPFRFFVLGKCGNNVLVDANNPCRQPYFLPLTLGEVAERSEAGEGIVRFPRRPLSQQS